MAPPDYTEGDDPRHDCPACDYAGNTHTFDPLGDTDAELCPECGHDMNDPDEVDAFIAAVENDEYAEVELATGDTLVTDWEGDGVFNPHIVPTGDHGDAHPTDILDAMADAIQAALDVHVGHIEYSPANGVFYPTMDRPTEADQ